MSNTFTAQESEDLLSSLRRLVAAQPRETVAPLSNSFLLKIEPAAVSHSLIPSSVEEERKLVLTPALRVVEEAGEEPLLLSRLGQSTLLAAPQAVEVAPAAPALDNVMPFPAALLPEPETEAAIIPEPEEAPFIALSDEAELPVQVAEFVAPEGDEPLGEPIALTEEEEPAGHWSEQSLPDVAWIAEAGGEWDDEESLAFASHLPPEPELEEAANLEWAEQAEAEVHAKLAQPRVPQPEELLDRAEDTEFFAQPQGAAMIDEDALRDIVRQIIREELSGALGERITRNVRKLVRVEVNRAMTASALE